MLNCIIMLTHRILINFQQAAIPPEGSPKEQGQETTTEKMTTSIINRCLSLDLDCVKGLILEHICGVIRIFNVCGVKDESAWDVFYDIIFVDPVTTRHLSQFPPMWPDRSSSSSLFREWGAAVHSYMCQMFDKSRDQLNNCRWDNPRAFGDEEDLSNPHTTS